MTAAKDIAKTIATECQKFYEELEYLKGSGTILQPKGEQQQANNFTFY